MGKSVCPHHDCKHMMRTIQLAVVQKRKSLGITQETLAEASGLSRNCIQQIECMEHLPDLLTISLVLDALGMSRQEFYTLSIQIQEAYRKDKEAFPKRKHKKSSLVKLVR